MKHLSLFLLALSVCCYEVKSSEVKKVNITVTPTVDTFPLNWKTEMTIECAWKPTENTGALDILVDSDSMFINPLYNSEMGEGGRLTFVSNEAVGTASLVIRDLSAADSGRTFICSVSRLGNSLEITAIILEPPTSLVTAMEVDEGFNDAVVRFTADAAATVYTVEHQAAGTADWTLVETSDVSVSLAGLITATTYNVRVKSGNAAGYRDDCPYAEVSFKTKDNRPCRPVDNLAVSEAEYNATSITVTWSMETNTGGGLIVNSITVTSGNISEEIAANATEYTFDFAGAGTYEIHVMTNNDFSAEKDTTAVASHTIMQTTEPPVTVKPTTPVPVPDPTTPVPVVPDVTEPKPMELRCSDVVTDYNAVEQIREVLSGEFVVVSCYLPEDSQYEISQVEWSYEGAKSFNHTTLLDAEGIDIKYETMMTSLNLTSINENQKGLYACYVGDKECRFEVSVSGMSRTESSSSALVPALLLLLSSSVLLLLQ